MAEQIAIKQSGPYSEVRPLSLVLLQAFADGKLDVWEHIYYRGDFPEDIERCRSTSPSNRKAGHAPRYMALLMRLRDAADRLAKAGKIRLAKRETTRIGRNGTIVPFTEYTAYRCGGC